MSFPHFPLNEFFTFSQKLLLTSILLQLLLISLLVGLSNINKSGVSLIIKVLVWQTTLLLFFAARININFTSWKAAQPWNEALDIESHEEELKFKPLGKGLLRPSTVLSHPQWPHTWPLIDHCTTYVHQALQTVWEEQRLYRRDRWALCCFGPLRRSIWGSRHHYGFLTSIRLWSWGPKEQHRVETISQEKITVSPKMSWLRL